MPANAADLMHPAAAEDTEVTSPAAVPESLESPGGQGGREGGVAAASMTAAQAMRQGTSLEGKKAGKAHREIGAVELALRNSSTRTTKYILEPVVGTAFDSPSEAYEFYNMYSWEVGFGIRDLTRGSRMTARCGCKSMIHLHRTDDHGWFVETNRSDHVGEFRSRRRGPGIISQGHALQDVKCARERQRAPGISV